MNLDNQPKAECICGPDHDCRSPGCDPNCEGCEGFRTLGKRLGRWNWEVIDNTGFIHATGFVTSEAAQGWIDDFFKGTSRVWNRFGEGQ